MSGDGLLWVNGQFMPVASRHISARDRGFTLGDGLFETILARRGDLVALARHLARLRAGAGLLHLPLPWTEDDLAGAVRETLTANGLTDGVARITLTRGVPRRRGLLPDDEAAPSLVIDSQPFAGYPAGLYARGMRLVTAAMPRNERSPLARAKTLAYLDNILARREAALAGSDEAVMLNTRGAVAGATAANLFLIRAGRLITPDLASGALPGVTRARLIEAVAPALDLPVEMRAILPGELAAADECCLTNALLGVMPATWLDGVPIGAGDPGPVTRRLMAALAIGA